MAGHSKWKNNLSRKTAQDKKRAVSFAKLSKSITISVIEGGSPDPAFNPRLRIAIDKARASSMPKDNIDRAIAKGSGPGQDQLVSLVFELFGPGGSQLIATATTDNQNRTYNEMRTLVERNGGKLGSTGSVAHMFTHCACIVLEAPAGDLVHFQEQILTLATDLEALDVVEMDEYTIIYVPFTQLHRAHEIVKTSGLTCISDPEACYRPLVTLTLDTAHQTTLEALIDLLEDHGDISDVYTNVV